MFFFFFLSLYECQRKEETGEKSLGVGWENMHGGHGVHVHEDSFLKKGPMARCLSSALCNPAYSSRHVP